MRVIEVTLGSGATQITPDQNATGASQIYVTTLVIAPAGATATLGDDTVTATKGIPISTTVPLVLTFDTPRGSLLSQYWLYGTPGDKVEVLYETAQ